MYGWAGTRKISSQSPISATRPAYMTTTRSASSATSPRSWVIRMIAACVSWRAISRISRTCAWMVTSSAVVASSATRIFGSLAIAIAIIARWRMPPENSCGYWRHRALASGMPTRSSSWIVRVRASAELDARPCARMVSSIWSPMDMTGLSDVFGSWKIIAMSLPRIGRSSSVDSSTRFLPFIITAPDTLAEVRRSSPIAASQVTLLPEPDSPTTPSVSPA